MTVIVAQLETNDLNLFDIYELKFILWCFALIDDIMLRLWEYPKDGLCVESPPSNDKLRS